MALDDRFTFRCGPELACFGNCCRDVNIVLTPYDVLRMKRALGMDSSEFLEKHTISPRFDGTEIPDRDSQNGGGDASSARSSRNRAAGSIADRPWACRMYPLGAGRAEESRPRLTSRFIS